MPHYTRRTLIKGSTTFAALNALSVLPNSLQAMRPSGSRHQSATSKFVAHDPSTSVLTDAALTAAQAAGATYADIRLTHTFTRKFVTNAIDMESMTFGVRALVDGYWGFAASPIWTVDEAVRLARMAVDNAKANVLGQPREIELAPVPAITKGQWIMPIKDDPFVTDENEITDFLVGTMDFIKKLPNVGGFILAGASFIKQDKVFASTANHFAMQRFYRSEGGVSFGVVNPANGRKKGVNLDTMTPAGLGLEYLREQALRNEILARHAEASKDLELPLKPVDVGRYALVLDAPSAAGLVSATIGTATELDRALGYEANAGGTSYINDPLAMIGTLKIGAPLLTVTANRTELGGAATTKWDDEGVAPEEFTVVKDGMLVDMQTNREGAGWLKRQSGMDSLPVASRGCAYAPEAIDAPLTHCANLTMQAAPNDATFDSLVADIPNGIAIKRAGVDMDFQQITGFGVGEAFEIKNGKRVAELQGAGFLFRTPELWNVLIAVGGAASCRRFGLEAKKGEPVQRAVHSVTAPPITIKELSVIDTTRKA